MSNALITQLNNPVVLQQLNKRLAVTVSLLLVVACAYLLVEVTWMFFPQEEETVSPSHQKNSVLSNTQARQNNFKQLTAANIFGVSEKAVISRQAKAPETKLNLTLKGVLAAMPMEMASAIIAQGKAGKEDIYGIGDKLPGGVSIKEIHPEYVVLQRNGQLETLRLQKITGVNFNASNKHRTNTGSAYSKKSPQAALLDVRRSILKDPASFGQYALPVVVKENGRQVGYRLQPQKKGGLLSDLGIQRNDVIIEINGVKLDKPQNGISALRKLSTAKNLSLVVKRQGAEVPLNISLP